MCRFDNIKILIYFDIQIPELPKSFNGRKVIYKYRKSIDNISEDIVKFEANAVFVNGLYLQGSPASFLLDLKENFGDELTIIFVTKKYDTNFIKNLLEAGAYDVVNSPVDNKSLLITLHKVFKRIQLKTDHENLIKKYIDSESILNEKNTILETILDILSHDSRNLFFNIFSLLKQIRDKEIRSLLQECVDELFQGTMEAVGYLGSKKRIRSLVSVIENLKLTQDRISLSNSKRIKFIHSRRYFLFVETSSLIKNAIINLVENGLKYSGDEKVVIIKLFREGEEILVDIIDFGEGIPDEEKEKIFTRHYRRKEAEKIRGSGRGLWITRNIIKKEGGSLIVFDNPEGGSVFRIKFPAFKIDNIDKEFHKLVDWFMVSPDALYKKAQVIRSMAVYEMKNKNYDVDSIVFANLLDHLRKEREEKKGDDFIKKLYAFKEMNPEGKTVLIVDDSLFVHYYLAAFFTESGFRVVDFSWNGREGVEAYKRHKPNIVTMDYTMPVMTGLEAAREIFKINRKASVIFLTGLGEDPELIKEIKTMLPGLNYRILQKPCKQEKLKAALDALSL